MPLKFLVGDYKWHFFVTFLFSHIAHTLITLLIFSTLNHFLSWPQFSYLKYPVIIEPVHVIQVEWPLSIVISRKALAKYQLIFRFLFRCKHVDRQLCGAWQVHQVWTRLYHSE